MPEDPEKPARTERQRETTRSWQHGLRTRRGWRNAEARRQAEAEQVEQEGDQP